MNVMVNDIMPFKNELYKAKLQRKRYCRCNQIGRLKALSTASHKPGIFYASGLKYSLDKTGTSQILDLHG